MFRKKRKNFRAIYDVSGHSKPKTFSVGQPWWPTFFRDLGPSTILVLLRPLLERVESSLVISQNVNVSLANHESNIADMNV